MEKIITTLVLLFSFSPFFAQHHSERAVLVFEQHQLNQAKFEFDDRNIYKASCIGTIPLENVEPFLAFSIVWYAKDWQEENYMTAFFHDGQSQLLPIHIHQDPHATPREGQFISQLYFTEKNVKKIRIRQSGTAEI